MNFENLTKLPIEELRTLAAQHGIKPHHKAKPETLAKQIIDKVVNPAPKKQEMQHPAQKPAAAPVINTEEQVREACKAYFSREGYEVTFTGETWHFKYAGAEDTGHMSVPLRIIRMKAESVARGARKPVTINFDGERIMAAG